MNLILEFKNAANDLCRATGAGALLGMACGDVVMGAGVGAAYGIMMNLDKLSRYAEGPRASARANDIA